MRDPYLYDDIDVIRNLLGIRDVEELERAEADIT
jgi:cell filamentation protein